MKPTICQCCSRQYVTEDYLKGTSKFRVCSKGNLWFECSCGSGLILKKGEFEWYSPTLNMSEAAKTVFSSVQEIKNIPLIPSAVLKLQSIIADENSSNREIGEALKLAPNIALAIIKTANTIKASSVSEITNLEHAISYVGRKTLSELILAESLQDFDFKTHVFSKEKYWQEAILCGKIAEYIAKNYATNVNKDEAYIAASLCNVGKIVSAICFPEVTDDITRTSDNPRRPKTYTESEDQLRSISHVVLGEVAAALWGFPEYIVHALSSHHLRPNEVQDLVEDDTDFLDEDDGDDSVDEGPTLQNVVALANQFTHWVMLQPHRIDELLFHKYGKIFGFDEKKLDDIGTALMDFREKEAS